MGAAGQKLLAPNGRRDMTTVQHHPHPQPPRRAHDPKARAVAKAVYDALHPRSVILFGSRARGDFRRDSDVDLLVITDGDYLDNDEYMAACDAANAKSAEVYGVRGGFGVDVVYMSAEDFRDCRRAKNHVAGQAAKDGVDMNGEPIAPDGQTPDNTPDIHQRIITARRNLDDLRINVVNSASQEAVGFFAQQALENALKGWISALDDEYDNTHYLSKLMATIRMHPAEDESDAGERLRWLTNYAVKYRYAGATIEMDDRRELLRVVNETVEAIIARISELTGRTNWYGAE